MLKIKSAFLNMFDNLKLNKRKIIFNLFVLTFMITGNCFANAATFFEEAVDKLGLIVQAIGAGLGIWGVVNLMEGYGNDNPAAKNQGIKQLIAGAGLILLGTSVVPKLKDAIDLSA